MAGRVLLGVLFGCSLIYVLEAELALESFEKYVKAYSNPNIAPVQTVGQPVEVTMVFQPINVAHVDEANNAMEIECIVMTSWDSGILFGRRYDDLKYVTLPKDYFWLPTLNPLQSAQKMEDQAPPVVTIFKNGTVVWFATYKIKFWCDVTSVATGGAPCSLSMAMWGYSKDRVAFRNIGNWGFQFSRYFAGSKYDITGYGVNFSDFPFEDRVYQFATFQMTVKEKPRRRPRIPFKATFQWF